MNNQKHSLTATVGFVLAMGILLVRKVDGKCRSK